jgi:hypothetical protein
LFCNSCPAVARPASLNLAAVSRASMSFRRVRTSPSTRFWFLHHAVCLILCSFAPCAHSGSAYAKEISEETIIPAFPVTRVVAAILAWV